MGKTGIIVQARVGSERLPGKVLKRVCGKTLLEHQIGRLLRVSSADTVIVATTTEKRDEKVVACADEIGVPCFRGSEKDVLSRFYEAAKAAGLRTVVRTTADCPLIDPEVTDRIIRTFSEARCFDYVSNTLTRTYPRGLDTEVLTFDALKKSHDEATDARDREHVTPYIYRHPGKFRLGEVRNPVNLSHHRWTVDTEDDFELIRRILEELFPGNPRFGLADCLELLGAHPDWFEINRHVEQRS